MAIKTYKEHLDDIIVWMQTIPIANASTNGNPAHPENRDWCTLDLTDLQPGTITAYFDNSDVNATYATEYNLGVLTNNPVAYLQLESDARYSLQKAFIMRHESRMDLYRHDCEQKDVRLYNLLNHATAKLEHLKNTA